MAENPLKIIALTDSEGMPRGKGWGNTPLEKTYPYLFDRLLKTTFGAEAPYFQHLGLRSGTVHEILREWPERVTLTRPGAVILQTGGTECTPRVFKAHELRLIKKLPRSLRRFLLIFDRRYRRQTLLRIPQRVEVSATDFQKAIEQICTHARQDGIGRLIFINVVEPTEHIAWHIPGLLAQVARYNAILAAFVEKHAPLTALVDVNAFLKSHGPKSLTVDGTHLNPLAHAWVASELGKKVLQLTEMPQRRFDLRGDGEHGIFSLAEIRHSNTGPQFTVD